MSPTAVELACAEPSIPDEVIARMLLFDHRAHIGCAAWMAAAAYLCGDTDWEYV